MRSMRGSTCFGASANIQGDKTLIDTYRIYINDFHPIRWVHPNEYADADEQLRLLDPTHEPQPLAGTHDALMQAHHQQQRQAALRATLATPYPHPIWDCWNRMHNFIQAYYHHFSARYIHGPNPPTNPHNPYFISGLPSI
jgi:hypothetical protein